MECTHKNMKTKYKYTLLKILYAHWLDTCEFITWNVEEQCSESQSTCSREQCSDSQSEIPL